MLISINYKFGIETKASSLIRVHLYLYYLREVMGSLLRSRTSLVVPKKRTLEDLVSSKVQICLTVLKQRYMYVYNTYIEYFLYFFNA